MADSGSRAIPENYDQLQPSLRFGGQRLQVSENVFEKGTTAPSSGHERLRGDSLVCTIWVINGSRSDSNLGQIICQWYGN